MQVVFGLLGDKFGRKGAYGWTLAIMIAMTVLSASASWGSPPVFIGLFVMWRFLLGFGIGGDYPLSAVITSEYTPKNIRGAMIAAVFSMQGVGFLAAAAVAAIVLACFKSAIVTVSLLDVVLMQLCARGAGYRVRGVRVCPRVGG